MIDLSTERLSADVEQMFGGFVCLFELGACQKIIII